MLKSQNIKSSMNSKNSNTAKTQQQIQASKQTAQEWLPLKDISNNFAKMRDGSLIAMIKIEPINIDLLSKNEKSRIFKGLHEILNGQQEGYQIFCMGKPINLDNYLLSLQNLANDTTNNIKKRLLQNYIKETSVVVSSGEVLERQFYIILTHKKDKKAEVELENRAKTLANALIVCDLKASLCTEKEILDVYFNFFQQSNAAFERSEFSAIPTQIYE